MQTRRDHVQAYQFAMGRLASALVTGDPGRGDSPTRRSALGTVFGMGVVVLLCAGFGVYGLLSPVAKTDWKKNGAVVLEKETGNRYVYANGVLYPARNYASALLIAGRRDDPDTVSAKSLAGVPHGAPVGIQGAPDTVPVASGLVTGAWARCLRAGAPAKSARKSAAGVGQTLVFGTFAGTLPALPANREVLLSGPGGARYLLVGGTKYPVPAEPALIALGLDGRPAVYAPADWLAAVPTGPALTAPVPPGAGTPGGKVAGRAAEVGQVFRTSTGGGVHYYVLRADGLAPVNATEYALLAARRGAPAARQVSQADIAVAAVSADRGLKDRLPDVLGARPLAAGTVCLQVRPGGSTRVVVGAASTRTVVIPPGEGVLAAPAGAGTLRYLITEQGARYRLDGDAASTLGLGDPERRLTLPVGVLTLIPEGPVLSRAAAAKG